MCTGEQKQARTPDSDRGRGGVWLADSRFAEAGSFEYLLWLKSEGMCHPLLSLLTDTVQKASHEERAVLALDFPDVVAALEAPDWYKAPTGRAEAAERRVAALESWIEEALGHTEGTIGALEQVKSDLEKAKEGT